jgi:DNA-binding transcriptional MocR family regulator
MRTKAAPEEGGGAWADGIRGGVGPLYLRIVDALERAVAQGHLRPGDRLPAQRQLASRLGVDLTTVTRAYAEARRQHLLEARGPVGTYVAAPKVELTQMVDLSMNIPPPPAGIDLADLLKQGVSQVLMRSDVDLLMTYHLGGGGVVDRAAGARWLAPMLGSVDAARVIVCPGAQAALAALILACTRPGDAILAEPLIYPGLRAAAAQLGRRVLTVPTDAMGMRPDALEQACVESGAPLIYLNPTLQNPTSLTMPDSRRGEIVRVAARYNARIIEDDPYWLLAEDAPAPLASHAADRVFYIATLSKCLSPGLRTAFVLLPDAQSQEAFLPALRSFALMSTPLTTALVTQWIHDGAAAQLLAGVRDEARARRGLAEQILATAAYPGQASGGVHVWHPLPSYWTALDLAAAARARGLAVTPANVFHAGDNPPNAIRISLGGGQDRALLAAALKTLSALLARKPSAERELVV